MTWKTVSENATYTFEEKKALEGTYTGKETGKGTDGKSTIHTVKTDSGPASFWGSTVLDGKLLDIENGPGFGTRVRITYLGKVKGKSPIPYRNYQVEYDEIPVIEENEPVSDANLPF